VAVLGLHRSKAIADKPLRIQAVGYFVVLVVMAALLLEVGALTKRGAKQFTTDIAKAVGDDLKPQLDREHYSEHAFGIIQNTPSLSRRLSRTLYWISLNGVRKITPIHVFVLYTITNLKSTPVMISELSLEMRGEHGTWIPMNNLPTGQPIWMADLRKPREVSLITPVDGFLVDNARNVELEPGRSIQGWMICQYPSDAFPTQFITEQPLRLKIRDTANDEEVQALDQSTTYSNVLSSSFKVAPANVDLTAYEVTTYGP
jgi:hypothetical protein